MKEEGLLSVGQVLEWTACVGVVGVTSLSAWVRRPKLWMLALRHQQPFSQTAGGGFATVLWGIVHPQCATLGRTLTDKWADVINSLSCWFWGMWDSVGASKTTRCTAGFFSEMYSTWMWHVSASENNLTWTFRIWRNHRETNCFTWPQTHTGYVGQATVQLLTHIATSNAEKIFNLFFLQ